ncbi:peptide MFS transporter [bacterium]|nr:peptide MFS transporter [bacterium]
MKQGHPKGLYLLFSVEMWERFSYYGMRALLVLYMTKHLLFDTEKAGQVYGWYTGLVYLTPLMGGYLADRYLGARKSILIGGILMSLGHFAMAFPGLPFFYGALLLLIIGNGFFKPNISTIVGQLYDKNDERRDSAFTIFYMGINLGAFFSPLICGTLGEKIGWHWGFGAAGVGMVFGLIMYLLGQKKYLGDIGLKPVRAKSVDQKDEPLTKVEKQRIAVIFILSFFVIFFWASFEQAGSSLTLFAERSTSRYISIFDWEMPVSYFQSVNPLLIFIFAPLFSKLWIYLAKRKKDPSTPIKFVIALVLLALGFVLMIFASKVFEKSGLVSMWWLIGVYFLHTMGELCLSPVGLSMVSRLSPAKFASLLMGTWFLSSFAANYVGGALAGNYDKMSPVIFFMIPTGTALGAAVFLLLISKLVKKWMHDNE